MTASVDAVQRFATRCGGSSAGAAAIGALVIELDACCKKIEWIRTDRPLIHSLLGRCAVERWLLPSA